MSMAEYDHNNPYMVKASSLALIGLGAIGTHVGQNAATKAMYKSPKFAKGLSNSFAEGVKGVADNSTGKRVSRAVKGGLLPEYGILNRSSHSLGETLRPHLKNMSKREQVALRMASEGRYTDLVRQGHHRNAKLNSALKDVSKATGVSIPDISKLTGESASRLQKTWTSKEYPLLSNVASQLGRGKVSSKAKPGNYNASSEISGSVALTALDPISGSMNTAKNVLSSETARKNKYIKRVSGKAENYFVKRPAIQGWKTPGTDYSKSLGSRIKEYGVNPTSVQIRSTSSALSDAVESLKPKNK